MSHIQFHEWEDYVTDQLDERTRQAYEDHLYDCDECLNQYMKAIEKHVDTVPISFEQKRPDILIDYVFAERAIEPKNRRRPFYQQSLFHYFIAAILTIVLMTSGLFAQLTQLPNQLATKSDPVQSESLTEQLLEKRLTFINKEAK